MKVWVYSNQKNERLMAPYFIRHYSSFADKIIVYDGGSTDGTLDCWKTSPKVEVRTEIGLEILDDQRFMDLALTCYKEARGQADWVMFVDADEFVWHPSMTEYLEREKQDGSRILRSFGYNMCGSEIPMDDPRQIYEILNLGIESPVYCKPVVFDPQLDIQWHHGKHDVNPDRPDLICMMVISELKLLHYRYLTENYAFHRNRRNWNAVPESLQRSGFGWTNHPDWKGEHSPTWVNSIIPKAKNVLEIPNPWEPWGIV